MPVYRVMMSRTRVVDEHVLVLVDAADAGSARKDVLRGAADMQWTQYSVRLRAPKVLTAAEIGQRPTVRTRLLIQDHGVAPARDSGVS